MKKKILSFALIFAFILPCMFIFGACTDGKSETKAVEVVIGDQKTSYDKLTDAVVEEDEDNVIKIKLNKDIVLDEAFHIVKNEYELDLNGHKVSFPDDQDGNGLFWVEYSGKLTINGDGEINSASQKNDYSMAVWANLGGTVIINGGTYTNVGAKHTEDNGTFNNNDLIYASRSDANANNRKSSITINGGKFIGNYENPNEQGGVRFTLNIRDKEPGEIIVKGGEYRDYDPANSKSENPAGNFVADGFKSVKQTRDGVDWYVVSEAE